MENQVEYSTEATFVEVISESLTFDLDADLNFRINEFPRDSWDRRALVFLVRKHLKKTFQSDQSKLGRSEHQPIIFTCLFSP